MKTRIGVGVHVDPSEIRHDVQGSGMGVLTFGEWPSVRRADMYFRAPADVDAVIAELAALRAEMTGGIAPGTLAADDTYRLTLKGYAALGEGGVLFPAGCNPDAPVITDSERDCQQANPASGAWCHKSGPHTEHRDTDGQTWTTAAQEHCEDTHARGSESFLCSLAAGHKGLHAALTPTGAFVAEWGYEDGHVHTTSGHQPAQDETPAAVAL